jgi:6-phosphogluconolactonase (cycloisomerase 2 family)
MDRTSTAERVSGIAPLSQSPVSRRAFLAGAAACAATSPTFLRAASYGLADQAVLHLATRSSQNGHVHTFALTPQGCELLESTAVDSFAAFASHPVLPLLYVARDCSQWEDLPRGVIETYAVQYGVHPLRLLAQTPMALSATGPRALAVAPCGRHLLVSASTGGAWNAFALDRDGIPAPVAITRKETGTIVTSRTMSLPTPHGLVFSPHGYFAVGTDPSSQRMTLLRPSSAGIAVLTRWRATCGLTPLCPVWTTDGRYIIAANAQTASLSIYEILATLGNGSKVEVHLLGTVQTTTPVKALLVHSTEPAVFTSRPQGGGSRLELWKMRGPDLRVAGDTWVSGDVVALAQHSGDFWVACEGGLIRISMRDLQRTYLFELPLHGTQAIITQNAIVHRFGNV